MLLRKRGETHKQFIKRLQDCNNRLIFECHEYERKLDDIRKQENIIHVDKYEKLVDRYNIVKNKLKDLGVWCGE